ncbi:MAG: type II toxin-antitoxin system RelE/ParE family toxin [Alphaproteobacteria bacterium]|nr:type II toxin-antitoxin system RelE/ParE family toxin [Alphaproteobacteria bacterium]
MPRAQRRDLQVRRLPRFIDDLTEAYAYLSERNPCAGDRLLDVVEATIEMLSAFPELGRPRDDLRTGVRSFKLRRFQHILFYRLDAQEMALLRLLHGARERRRNL